MSPKLFVASCLFAMVGAMEHRVEEGRMAPSVLAVGSHSVWDTAIIELAAMAKEDTMTEEKDQIFDEEDGAERWLPGISVEDLNSNMRRVRQIRDVLDNSVQELYGKDPEVTKWADALGGLRKVQEKLVGLKLTKRGWYKQTLKRLKDEKGYDPKPLGEPQDVDISLQTATSHSTYAVEAHRRKANQKRHGEVADDELTLPNWAATTFDFDVATKPSWWKKVSMSRFSTNTWQKKDKEGNLVPMSLKQVDGHGKGGRSWMYDIRISKKIGNEIEGESWAPMGGAFNHISRSGLPFWQAIERDSVKKLIDLFYNSPRELTWKKIGTGDKQRWAAGYQLTIDGPWLYCRVSKKGHDMIEFMHGIDRGVEPKAWDKYRWVKGNMSVKCSKNPGKVEEDKELRVICEEFQQIGRWEGEWTISKKFDQLYTREGWTQLAYRLKKDGWTKVLIKKGNQ